MGFRNRNNWDFVSFEDVKKDPSILAMSVGRWVSSHDPEQYVYDKWHSCLNNIVSDAPFENTNLPPGHKYKPWTIAEVMEAQAQGREIIGPGDWT